MKVDHKRILIIDSDSTTVYGLFAVFVRQGYEVETSQWGYDAVSILKAIDPEIQIIMTSQDNNMDLEAQVRKQDIFYYYIKSFDKEELIEAVRDVFQKQKKA